MTRSVQRREGPRAAAPARLTWVAVYVEAVHSPVRQATERFTSSYSHKSAGRADCSAN